MTVSAEDFTYTTTSSEIDKIASVLFFEKEQARMVASGDTVSIQTNEKNYH